MLLRLKEWGADQYGKTTSEKAREQRIGVMDAWLVAGLLMSRLDDVRGMFDDFGVDMADSLLVSQDLFAELGEEAVKYFGIVKNLPDLDIATRDFW
ncbi:unnamed protein product, partial [Ectocarpus sp. 12 AP-2014]